MLLQSLNSTMLISYLQEQKFSTWGTPSPIRGAIKDNLGYFLEPFWTVTLQHISLLLIFYDSHLSSFLYSYREHVFSIFNIYHHDSWAEHRSAEYAIERIQSIWRRGQNGNFNSSAIKFCGKIERNRWISNLL